MNRSLKVRLKKYWLYRNLANLISYYKFAAIAVFIYLIIFAREQLFWMIFFFYSGVFADLFDGKIARWLDIVSDNGSLIDRIGDKVLIGFAQILMFFLLFPRGAHWLIDYLTLILVWLIIGVEAILSLAAVYGYRKGLRISSNRDGKNKMGWESGSGMYWLLGTYIAVNWWPSFWNYFIFVLHFGLIVAFVYGRRSAYGYWKEYKTTLPSDGEIQKIIQTGGILLATVVFAIYIIVDGVIESFKEKIS